MNTNPSPKPLGNNNATRNTKNNTLLAPTNTFGTNSNNNKRNATNTATSRVNSRNTPTIGNSSGNIPIVSATKANNTTLNTSIPPPTASLTSAINSTNTAGKTNNNKRNNSNKNNNNSNKNNNNSNKNNNKGKKGVNNENSILKTVRNNNLIIKSATERIPSKDSTDIDNIVNNRLQNNAIPRSSFMQRIRDKLPSSKSVSETLSEATNTTNNSWVATFFQAVLIIVVVIAIYYVSKYLYHQYRIASIESPFLVEGIKNSKNAIVISQDPSNPGYRPILRSENQNGIQFTYEFWIMVEGYDYLRGEWKHVFHKGDAKSYPNRAPGVWLHPETNAMRVYMNTQKEILEWVDVHNMPIRKWVHVALVLDDNDLDVYINGFLKTRKKLSSVPRQNNGDLWINMYGGFEGNLARLQYHPRAISSAEIHDSIKRGPGYTACIDTGELPPYLDDNWWLAD